jgi:hypothetical protein
MKPVARSLVLAILLLHLPAWLGAEIDQQFAWSWPLNPSQEERVWRVRLGTDQLDALHQPDGSDLALVDADGAPIPLFRLPDSFLIERLTRQLDLQSQSMILDDPEQDTEGLELVLHHDGTRLTVRSPQTTRQLDRDGRLVFEALIAAPGDDQSLNQKHLRLELGSEQSIALDCRLRDADDEQPATQRLRFQAVTDSRPRRFLAEMPVEDLPRAWHLACYGQQVPADLSLTGAVLESKSEQNHQDTTWVQPQLDPSEDQPGAMEFKLGGPYRLRAIRLDSDQANLLSTVSIRSRTHPNRPWRQRGQMTFSTLDESTSELELSAMAETRDRYWQLQAEPALREFPEVSVEVVLEELVFLAQGRSPWVLFAGSRLPGERSNPTVMLEQTVAQLGPAWTWPVMVPGERTVAGGEDVLEAPPEPIPWQRYLLWLALIVGAGLVVVLAVSLLRTPAARSD